MYCIVVCCIEIRCYQFVCQDTIIFMFLSSEFILSGNSELRRATYVHFLFLHVVSFSCIYSYIPRNETGCFRINE
jgi:hypothetical protein